MTDHHPLNRSTEHVTRKKTRRAKAPAIPRPRTPRRKALIAPDGSVHVGNVTPEQLAMINDANEQMAAAQDVMATAQNAAAFVERHIAKAHKLNGRHWITSDGKIMERPIVSDGSAAKESTPAGAGA